MALARVWRTIACCVISVSLDVLGLPVLAGLSRKRLIWKPLDITIDEALNGTTIVNTLALCGGASILRVHDVKEAVQAVTLFNLYHKQD